MVRKQASHLFRIGLISFVISCAIFETDHEKNHRIAGLQGGNECQRHARRLPL